MNFEQAEKLGVVAQSVPHLLSTLAFLFARMFLVIITVAGDEAISQTAKIRRSPAEKENPEKD